jgi:hypothetical protein
LTFLNARRKDAKTQLIEQEFREGAERGQLILAQAQASSSAQALDDRSADRETWTPDALAQ